MDYKADKIIEWKVPVTNPGTGKITDTLIWYLGMFELHDWFYSWNTNNWKVYTDATRGKN